MELYVAPVPNPHVLSWAREQSGYSLERVARRLRVRPEQVTAWETGVRSPTLRQVHELGRLYRRPLSVLYQVEPPRTQPPALSYRRLRGVQPGAESPELRLAVRTMLARRETAWELYEQLGYAVPEFGLQAHPGEAPTVVGERVRTALGVTIAAQMTWSNVWQAWRSWRLAIEDAGVLVFMFPDVPLKEARGMTLPARLLPVVAVNTRETPGARPYTALHELTHLMLANAGEEGVAATDRHSTAEWAELEGFAESVASFALIPEDWLKQELARSGVPEGIEPMRALAARFNVTPLAIATRLRHSGYLTWAAYRTWRNEWDACVAEHPVRTGFARPEQRTLGRCGAPFAQLVLEAYDSHQITTAEAARYLSLRPDRFEKLRERLAAGTRSRVPDE